MPLQSEQSTLVATVLPATPLQILTSHLGFKENEVGVAFEEQSVTSSHADKGCRHSKARGASQSSAQMHSSFRSIFSRVSSGHTAMSQNGKQKRDLGFIFKESDRLTADLAYVNLQSLQDSFSSEVTSVTVTSCQAHMHSKVCCHGRVLSPLYLRHGVGADSGPLTVRDTQHLARE